MIFILKPVKWLWKHKLIATILLILLGSGAYFLYQKNTQSGSTVEYNTTTVSKGMLISSISGTGQVSSSNQVDLKPKVSGNIITLAVVKGQEVKKGDLIARIDNRDAVLELKEAQSSYENAQLALDELLTPVDAYTLLQAENSVADAKDSLAKLKFNQTQDYDDAAENLSGYYDDAYNEISDVFLDLPDIMTSLNTILYSYEIANSESTVQKVSNNFALLNAFAGNNNEEKKEFEDYSNDAEDYYESANDNYKNNFDNYREISRYSDEVSIENLLSETIDTLKKVSDALKNSINMLDFWVEYRNDKGYDIFSKVTEYESNLNSNLSQTNSHLNTLISLQRNIKNSKINIEKLKQNQPLDLAASQRSLKEKEEKLNELLEGATELEIRNQQLVIEQKYNALINAQQNLSDHSVVAPFDGIIGSLAAKLGDSLSSATVIASIITEQKIAEVTLNEIDAASVTVGQKVNLEFDAVKDLTVTGEIIEVDTIGTVNQGVVSYNIKIGFDVQDDKIKPGMSTSATIIIKSKSNVLLIPITAVKTLGNNSYVEILLNGQVEKQNVTTGDSDDTMIEIIDGLEEGQEVISSTISTSSSSNSSNSNNFGPGGGASMGGMMGAFR